MSAPGSPARTWAIGLTLSSLAGWLILVDAPRAGLSPWIWLALWAAPAGVLAGARLGMVAMLLPPLVGGICTMFVESPVGAAGPALAAVLALYFAGASLGRWTRPSSLGARPWALAGLALFAVGALTALPSMGGALAQPWPPSSTALALDLSPVAWVLESGGVDWMRHPSVYERAGAGDLGPELRVPHSGWVGPLAGLVAGLVVLGVAATRGRASRTA